MTGTSPAADARPRGEAAPAAGEAASPAGLRGGSRLVPALAVAAVSRFVIFATGAIAPLLWRPHDVHPIMRFPEVAEAYGGWLGRLLDPWAHFDGVWFLHIAVEGYTASNNTPAFFPAYPAALRAAGLVLGGAYELAGVLLSIALLLAATAALYRLVADDFTPRVAFYATVFVSFSPVSFFFQSVYSESLFLLASVACFLFARRRRWALAALAAMVATVTRLAGLFLLVPMALAFAQGYDRRDPRRDRPLLWFLLVPAGVAAYAVFLSVATSSDFGEAERAWGRQPALPFETLWIAAVRAYQGASQLLTGDGVPPDPAYVRETLAFIQRETAIVNLVSFGAMVIAVTVLAFAWRRLPRAYSLYALAVVCLPLIAPRPQVPLMSMPRFVLVAFPVMVAVAVLTDRRPLLRWTALTLSVATLVFLSSRFALWLFVA
jgi:hypothetical protein